MSDLLLSMGPYRLLSPIHPLGECRVLGIRDDQPGGPVVLLDCYGSVGDRDFLFLWADEASLAVQVKHPHLLPLREVLVAEQPAPREGSGQGILPFDFLVAVYDRVPTVPMLRLLRSTGPAPVPIAVSMAQGMLSALQAVHEHRDRDGVLLGMMFRNLSPHDVLLSLDGRLLLTNLAGLNHQMEDRASHAGRLKGMNFSFLFFSPEQLRGLPRAPRDNLWAAAMILWTWLTGVPLYRHESDIVSFQSIVDGQHPPLAQLAPHLPPALLAFFTRAFHRDPAARYPTAAAMLADLVTQTRPATEEEVAHWARAHNMSRLVSQEEEWNLPRASVSDEEESEALDYRSAPRPRQAPRVPHRPAHSPISPSLWRRWRWWWARRKSS